MSTNVLAAGWTTSNSLRIVAPSLEITVLPEIHLKLLEKFSLEQNLSTKVEIAAWPWKRILIIMQSPTLVRYVTTPIQRVSSLPRLFPRTTGRCCRYLGNVY